MIPFTLPYYNFASHNFFLLFWKHSSHAPFCFRKKVRQTPRDLIRYSLPFTPGPLVPCVPGIPLYDAPNLCLLLTLPMIFLPPPLHQFNPFLLYFLGKATNFSSLPVAFKDRTDVQQVPLHCHPPCPSDLLSLPNVLVFLRKLCLRLSCFEEKKVHPMILHTKGTPLVLSSPWWHSAPPYHPSYPFSSFPIVLALHHPSSSPCISLLLLLLCRKL